MNASTLLTHVDVLAQEGVASGPLGAVQHDSRRVRTGDVFVARRGVEVDGHSFLDAAARAGAGEWHRLDGRVVQGGRLKFSSLRRRGFEPHSSQKLIFCTEQKARRRLEKYRQGCVAQR